MLVTADAVGALEKSMPNLSDSQLIILSKGAARPDGVAVRPDDIHRAACAKLGASLVKLKLMREIRSRRDMPVWRENADGKRLSLVLTSAGRARRPA